MEFVWLFARFTWIFILTDSRNTKQLNNRLSIPACPYITKTKSLEINKTPWYMPDHEVIAKFFISVEFWSLKPTTFSPPVLSDVRTILNHCIRFILFQTKHTLPLQTSTAGRQSKDVIPCRWRLQAWSNVSKLVYKNSTNRNCFNSRNNNENTSAFMYDLRTSWSDLHCLKLFNHTK